MNISNKPQKEEQSTEPGLPLRIPVSLIRWITYSALFFILILATELTIVQSVCVALILGHFSAQLNAIKDKL